MKPTKSNHIVLALALLTCLSTLNLQLSTAFAQGTAFTYQGRLDVNGNPANGLYDLRFVVWDALTSGNIVAGPMTNSATGVTNGLFTITLDFGSGVFTGPARWLQLDARTNGSGAFTTLTPRQQLTPTPYAILAGTASSLSGTLPVSQVSGVVLLAQLPAAVMTNNATSVTLSGNLFGNFGGSFFGNGGGLTGLNPANLSAGTAAINISGNAATAVSVTGNIADSQLPANVARLNGTNNFTGTNAFAGVTLATNVNNVIAGTFIGNGGGLTNLNPAQFANPVLTNGQTGVTLGGTFNGNATTATTANNFSGSLSGNVTGTQGATVVATVGGQTAANVASGANAANAATSVNTANTIVKRDASGNFSASTVTANLAGNATTATSATTATTANNFSGLLSGDVTGTQGATVVSSVSGQTAANVASGASAANAATSANTADTIVKRDASGNFSAGTITANLSGNATLATTAASLAIPSGMALIPAGAFTMGDNLDGMSDARPTNVTVSAFYMDVNLVSFSQWQSVYYWATNHGYGFVNAGVGKAANHPVLAVDWWDTVKWSNARSQQAGKTPVYYTDAGLTQVFTNGEVTPYVNWTANGYRLPTEAEWEKAARGGLSGQRFPWGNVITESLANYMGNTGYSYDLGPNGYNAAFATGGSPYTSPVGYFAPNGYGLYDMAGNVYEWCWDWYGTPYAGGSDPRGPASGSIRMYRGGDWIDYAWLARCAFRGSVVGPGYAGSSSSAFGFRCVRGL